MVTMGRVRRVVALVVLAATGTGLTAAPALAQDLPPEETSTTTTTTAPPETTTTTTTIPPGLPPAGDAPPETAPNVPDTVPPRQVDVGDPSATVPRSGYAVRVDLRLARASALARQAAWEAAVSRRTQLEQTLTALQDKISKLDAANRKAIRDLADAKVALRDRAVAAYVRGNDFETLPLDGVTEADEQRATLMTAIVNRDKEAVDRVRELQTKVSKDQVSTVKELTDTQAELELARVEEAQAEVDLFDAKLDLAVSSAGGSVVIHGFVFPVADPNTFRQDFGDPRMPGTEFEHSHEGCDVIAAEGTELYAAERGIVTQISNSYLGGLQLWIKGESNTSYYYAHLSGYAPGLRQGQVIEAGDLVGFVGQTGNAFGPHLHFEVHPNGGAAIDPYPLLLVADQQDGSTRR